MDDMPVICQDLIERVSSFRIDPTIDRDDIIDRDLATIHIVNGQGRSRFFSSNCLIRELAPALVAALSAKSSRLADELPRLSSR